MRNKHFINSVCIAFLIGVALPALAQPAAPLKLLVGFPPGGAPDVVARLYADQMKKATGANVVVENRAGASGKLAIDALFAASADGNTLALIPSAVLALIPHTLKSAKFNPTNDFVPIASLAEYGFTLATGPGVPRGNLEEFLKWVRSNPGKASFGTPGLGTPQHFLGASLAKTAGVDLAHVPYRGGAQALTDVLGGRTSSLITTEPLVVPLHAKKELNALIVTSPQRNLKMADVPTAQESGFVYLEAVDWFGLFARAGTPGEVVRRLQQQAGSVVALKEYVSAVTDLGYRVSPARPEQLRAMIEKDVSSWGTRVKVAGFTAEE